MTRPLTPKIALVCAAAVLSAASAQADVSYFGFASADNRDTVNRLIDTQTGTTPGPTIYSASAGGNFATSTTDAANGGSVLSYAQSVSYRSPVSGFFVMGSTGALSTIRYQPTLVGPASTSLLIPVRVTATGRVDGVLGGLAQATFGFTYRDGYYADDVTTLIGSARSTANTATFSSSFTVDEVVWVVPNAALYVILDTSSQAGSNQPTSWAQSYVDPTFTIVDPTLAELYHFEGIPGLVGAVPEPASWALLVLGLGVVLGRRPGRRCVAASRHATRHRLDPARA